MIHFTLTNGEGDGGACTENTNIVLFAMSLREFSEWMLELYKCDPYFNERFNKFRNYKGSWNQGDLLKKFHYEDNDDDWATDIVLNAMHAFASKARNDIKSKRVTKENFNYDKIIEKSDPEYTIERTKNVIIELADLEPDDGLDSCSIDLHFKGITKKDFPSDKMSQKDYKKIIDRIRNEDY